MRLIPPPEEFPIYGAEGKQLLLRYFPVDLPTSDRDCEALELVIDIAGCGIGPYRTFHRPVAIRLGRSDCEHLQDHLSRSGEPGQGELTLGGVDGISLTVRPGFERWTKPRPYTQLMIEGYDLWREFPSAKQPDNRLYVWLYPEMVARLAAVLRDLLRAPVLRRLAVPPPKVKSIAIDPVEYIVEGWPPAVGPHALKS